MSQASGQSWKDHLTVIQKVTPPFVPSNAEVMTVTVTWPPGVGGAPPHRHLSGPVFGYVIEGEMVFGLEGRAHADYQGRRGILGTRRRSDPLRRRQQPHRYPVPLHCHDDVRARTADANSCRSRRARGPQRAATDHQTRGMRTRRGAEPMSTCREWRGKPLRVSFVAACCSAVLVFYERTC